MLHPARWFYIDDGARQGPLELEDVRQQVVDGVVGPDTWVWADGMPTWMAAAEVPALIPPATLGLDGWPPPGT